MTALARIAEPVGSPADRLTAEFVGTRRKANPNTGDAYARDLASWLDWCRARQVNPLDAWPAHVQAWQADLSTTGGRSGVGESGSTRARRLGAVSSWYGWLIRHQAAPRNPAALERQERPVRAPRGAPALSREQVEALMAAADAEATRPRRGRPDHGRTAAVVYLLVLTGIRVGELVAADVADVGLDQGATVLHVRGKGGKSRVRPIPPVVWARLDAYLSARTARERAGALVPADQAGAGRTRPLIATDTGGRVDRGWVRAMLRRLAARAGLPATLVDVLSPHSTRVTFITDALADGVPIYDVARAAGHARTDTTQGYDRGHLSPDRDPTYRAAARYRVGPAAGVAPPPAAE